MMQTNERRATGRDAGRRKGVIAAVVLPALAIVATSACSGDDDTSADTTNPSGAVELPQNPSLRIITEDDTFVVENDGNVTMSDVEVREDSGDVVCELGTLSPDDREPCDEAAGRDDLSAHGLGPQGQEVDVGSG